MTVETWLQGRPAVRERSKLISQISRALRKTGPKADETRTLIHGLHRQHLLRLAFYDFPTHFIEVLQMLLILTEDQVLL